MADKNKKTDDIFADIDYENITADNIDDVLKKIQERTEAAERGIVPHGTTPGASGPALKIFGTIAVLSLTLTFCAAINDHSDNTTIDTPKKARHTIGQDNQNQNEDPKDENSIWDSNGGTLVPGTPGIVPGVSLF